MNDPQVKTVACKACGSVWRYELPEKVVLGGLNAVADYFTRQKCGECGSSAWLDLPDGTVDA